MKTLSPATFIPIQESVPASRHKLEWLFGPIRIQGGLAWMGIKGAAASARDALISPIPSDPFQLIPIRVKNALNTD